MMSEQTKTYIWWIGSGVLLLALLLDRQYLQFGERLVLIFFIITLLFFKNVFKRNITGELISGVILGITVEFLTEPNWSYNMDPRFYIGNADISVFVILGWGYHFLWFLFLSEMLYKAIFRKSKIRRTHPYDPCILLCDALVGVVWFVGNELLGMKLGLWEYNTTVLGWNTLIPWINFPVEGVIAAFLFSLTLPTFVRHWERAFDLHIKKGKDYDPDSMDKTIEE